MVNKSKKIRDLLRTIWKMKTQTMAKIKILKDCKACNNKIWTMVMNKWEIKNKILMTRKDSKTTKMKIQIQNKISKKMNLIQKVETKNSKTYSTILETHPNILKRKRNPLVSHSKNLKNPLKIPKILPTNKKRETSSQRVTTALKIKEDDILSRYF